MLRPQFTLPPPTKRDDWSSSGPPSNEKCAPGWGSQVVYVARAKLGELGTDHVAGAVEVIQDDEGFFPGRAGLMGTPGGMVGVADVIERLGLAPAMAGLAVQVERTLVAGGRFGVVAQLMMGVAQTVPDVALLLGVVAKFLLQLESLPAVAERLPVIAELGMEPADPVQGQSLAEPVAGSVEQIQCLLGMAERVCATAPPLKIEGQIDVDAGLGGAVP